MNIFKKLFLLDCRVCPWWLAYTFDNRLRRIFHDPENILAPYVKEGMTVIDIGCGMGYFSIGLAKLVGEKGLVLSVDIQQKMLNVLEKRARNEGIAHRIRLHQCKSDTIGINQQVDFALTFWMLHEVPHTKKLFEEISSILKSTGKYLSVEPKVHVSRACFEDTLNECTQSGFRIVGNPDIALSRAALLEKI